MNMLMEAEMKTIGYILFAWIYNLSAYFCTIREKFVFFNGHDYELNGNLLVMYQQLQQTACTYHCITCSKRQLFQYEDGRGKSLVKKIKGCFVFFVILPYHMATAEKVFFNDNFIPLAYMHTKRRRTQFIQLWHGAGAFKRFGLSTEQDDRVRQLVIRANERITHLFVTSEQVVPYYQEAFGISKEKIYVTGVPVTDQYFDENAVQRVQQKFYHAYPELQQKKILLFAPTFRMGETDNENILKQFCIEQIHETLGEDWVILIKMHPKFPTENIEESKYCYNMTHYHDISELYFVSDLLVTDYSSTVVEYVLLNKPVLLFAYDLNQYDRGFYRSYEETAPGMIAYSQEELLKYLSEKRDNMVKRQTFVKLQYDYIDGRSTERIMEILG